MKWPNMHFSHWIILSIALFAAEVLGGEDARSEAFPPYYSLQHNTSLHWGTYRPHLYLGLRTRHPESSLFGVLWSNADDPEAIHRFRHDCQQESGLRGYGWTQHDGRNYGSESIIDETNGVVMTAEFLKRPRGSLGGDWSLRLKATPLDPTIAPAKNLSVIFYVALQSSQSHLSIVKPSKLSSKGLDGTIEISGQGPDVGPFTIVVPEDSNRGTSLVRFPRAIKKHKQAPDPRLVQYGGMASPFSMAWRAPEVISMAQSSGQQKLRTVLLSSQRPKHDEAAPFGPQIVPPLLPNHMEDPVTTLALQWLRTPPFEIELAFVSHAGLSSENQEQVIRQLTGTKLASSLSAMSEAFGHRFERTFRLAEKGTFSKEEQEFAMAVFSNLIGGIGYFHGPSIVHEEGEQPPASIYTAVPSRSFFPRGFLWDEGFHELVISVWDLHISLDVLSHWLHRMDEDGWIHREQILGQEARSKVPQEFQAQHREHANPPSFVFLLSNIAAIASGTKGSHESHTTAGAAHPAYGGSSMHTGVVADEGQAEALHFLKEEWGRLKRYFEWLKRTQAGEEPDTFRWRGRSANGLHTLSSGLDDFPRSPTPLTSERHLDLHCWMIICSQTMAQVASALGKDADVYKDLANKLTNNLDDLFWNNQMQAYTDYIGTPEVLAEVQQRYEDAKRRLAGDPSRLEAYIKAAPKPPKTTTVNHLGYVSLFPMIAGAIPPTSEHLKATLDLISDPKKLWSKYGLRSLSLSDPLFGKDEDYWRGAIWININYLVLRGLKRYYMTTGPYAEHASEIYVELRKALVDNLFKEYKRTGYLWEQYDGVTGRGRKSHPFTGWSSLVVLMMGEIY